MASVLPGFNSTNDLLTAQRMNVPTPDEIKLATREPLAFKARLESEIQTFQEEQMARKAEGHEEIVDIKAGGVITDAAGLGTTSKVAAPDATVLASGSGAYIDYADYAYRRTHFIRDLTRELFLERAKSNPSGKIPTDYAKIAYDGAVSVADVLGLVD